MEKSERHHIKENDFLLVVERGYDLLLKYKREVLYGVGIVVGLILLWWGWTAFSGSRERHASQMLAQALGAEPTDLAKVKLVASKYSGLPSGRSAAALVAVQEGKAPQETAAALEDLVPRVKDATLRGILVFNAVILTAEARDADGAMKLIEKYRDEVPGEMALLLQGRVREIEGKTDEAKALYNRLIKEFPESSLRYMAQQRASVL
jgi:predicted negative regulator of RcsB-dependent stress response